MDSNQYPRSLAHVGLTVPDIEDAIRWYTEVLGWRRLKGPWTSKHLPTESLSLEVITMQWCGDSTGTPKNTCSLIVRTHSVT
ncbi:VOC family protein [Halorussus rarus]|uniref:VOC family protein n=1 Tax=Halorussus TaxID=1070314 RepID=UPI0019665FBA